jgi:hypothetical protein
MGRNWADESYVKLYTRDSLSWKLLGWEGQTVLLHMLRDRFDRSGVFEYGCHNLSHAVTAVTGLPLDVTERGLEKLLGAGTWVISDGKLVWPEYVEAQLSRKSDRLRQQESRKNRKQTALSTDNELSRFVTACDNPSRPVTTSHSTSQNVTLRLEENRLEETTTTARAREPEPQQPPSKIPCPSDLQLGSDQVGTLTSSGIPDWAIQILTTQFVASSSADPSDIRTLVAWRKCLSRAISGNWNDRSKRPKKPEADESSNEPRFGNIDPHTGRLVLQ